MTSTGMHGRKPWQPQLETQAEFNPFVSPIAHLGEAEPRWLDADDGDHPGPGEEAPEPGQPPAADPGP